MSGAVHGTPRALLRLEGLALLAGAACAYWQVGGGAALFAAAFLLPDLALLAYLAGPRWGARAYNLTHTTLLPAVGLIGAWAGGVPPAVQLTLVWLAHIGLDRLLGFGLKYASGFAHTHLGRLRTARAGRTIGRAPAPARQ